MTARIDGDLKRAVAAKAAERGETVTDVIVRALTAYIQDAASAPAPPRAVYTPPAATFREPAPVPARKNCTHPGVIKGICHAPGCGIWVSPKR